MGGPGQARFEAARDLVLALGTRLEGAQTVGNAVVDALVVAGLEMQAVVVGVGAPIAAIERIGGAEKHRHRHRLAGAHRQLDEKAGSRRAGDAAEERTIQIRRVAVADEGDLVQSEHALDQRLAELIAAQRAKFDALLEHTPALAARLLALVGREAVEKIIEVAIAAVVPLEMTVAPQ